MIKWTIEKLEKRNENWQRKYPAPFPGKYPTRIAWKVVFRKGISRIKDGRMEQGVMEEVMTYVGKPNKMELLRLPTMLREMQMKGWSPATLTAYEFDTQGLLSKTIETGSARFTQRSWCPTYTAGALRAYYHPWEDSQEHLKLFTGKFWLKRIKGKLKVHTIYSPMETLTEGAIKDFKVALTLGAEKVTAK